MGCNHSSSVSGPLLPDAGSPGSARDTDSSAPPVHHPPRNPRGVRFRTKFPTALKQWERFMCQPHFPPRCFVSPTAQFCPFVSSAFRLPRIFLSLGGLSGSKFSVQREVLWRKNQTSEAGILLVRFCSGPRKEIKSDIHVPLQCEWQ